MSKAPTPPTDDDLIRLALRGFGQLKHPADCTREEHAAQLGLSRDAYHRLAKRAMRKFKLHPIAPALLAYLQNPES